MEKMKDRKRQCVAHIDSDKLIRAQANGVDLKSLLPLLQDLKQWIETNQSSKKEVQKDIERLMNQLQRGIESIMEMLDIVIKQQLDD